MAPRTLKASSPLLAVLALGCTTFTISGTVPEREYPKSPLPPSGFQVGAARADLTPIPGISLHGYSSSGSLARGFWTRIYARAIYLEDDQGVPLVLVMCDLAMIPNGLSDVVAKQLSEDDTLDHIGREQLVLAATHNHHGPGNFLTSQFYNTVSPAESGFDPELFEFLSRGITQAIRTAYSDRKPALVRARSGKIARLVKNRSLEAFLLNGADAKAWIEGTDCGSATADPTRCVSSCSAPADPNAYAELKFAECAADPRIRILEFRKLANPDELIALAAFVSAHNTVLNPGLEVYAADLFGAASLLVEGHGTPSCGSSVPVAALFNGASGDVSPVRKTEGQRDRVALLDPAAPALPPQDQEGRGLALRLAEEICGLVSPSPFAPDPNDETAPRISFRFEKLQMTARPYQAKDDVPSNYKRSTAPYPQAGAAAVGGSEEDGTGAMHALGYEEGLRNHVRGEHGAKIPPFELPAEVGGRRMSLAGAVFGLVPPPVEAPLGIYQLGTTAFVSLPGEFTTLMGERVSRTVRANLSPAPDRLFLIGLSNGHISYFPTPEEYDAQHYEGANDFYGAAAGPYLQCELVRMAELLSHKNPPTECTGTATTVPANPCWAPTIGVPPPLCSSPPAEHAYEYEPGTPRVFRPRDAVGPWGDRPGLLRQIYQSATGAGPSISALQDDNYATVAPVHRVDDGLSAVVQDLQTRYPERDFPAYCWNDAIPRLLGLRSGDSQCTRAVPFVAILDAAGGLVTSNDWPHLDVVTTLVGVGEDKTQWCAIWLAPPGTSQTDTFQFAVKGILASPPVFAFTLSSAIKVARPEPLPPDMSGSPVCKQDPSQCSVVCQAP